MFLCSSVLVFLWFSAARAQLAQPAMIVSWHADTFAPSGFEGKQMPVYDSALSASVDMFFGGRFLSLKNSEVRWYVDSILKNRGKGEQMFSYTVKSGAGTPERIRVEVDYLGSTYLKDVYVRIGAPAIVMARGRSAMSVGVGENIFRALTYHFIADTRDDIAVTWGVNGTDYGSTGGASSDVLLLNIPNTAPDGQPVVITASANSIRGAVGSAETWPQTYTITNP